MKPLKIKCRVTIDDIPIEVIGIYHPKEVGGERDEILPSCFEIESYDIEEKYHDTIVSRYKKGILEDIIAEKALDYCKME